MASYRDFDFQIAVSFDAIGNGRRSEGPRRLLALVWPTSQRQDRTLIGCKKGSRFHPHIKKPIADQDPGSDAFQSCLVRGPVGQGFGGGQALVQADRTGLGWVQPVGPRSKSYHINSMGSSKFLGEFQGKRSQSFGADAGAVHGLTLVQSQDDQGRLNGAFFPNPGGIKTEQNQQKNRQSAQYPKGQSGLSRRLVG